MSPAASWTSPATLAACFLASPKARLKSEFCVRVSAIGMLPRGQASPDNARAGQRFGDRNVYGAVGLFRQRVAGTEGSNMDQPKLPEPEIMPPVPKTEPQRVVPEIPPDTDAPEKRSPSQGEN